MSLSWESDLCGSVGHVQTLTLTFEFTAKQTLAGGSSQFNRLVGTPERGCGVKIEP